MKIKQKYLVIYMIFCSFLLNSCTEFLEVKPTDFIASQNYFNTENEADMAIAGVYKPLNELYGGPFKNGFSSVTDELAFNRLNGEFMKEKTYNSFTPAVASIWNNLYKGIYYANFFIENIDKVKVPEIKKNSLRAEARFLRGYYYYHLAMLFGDVPLRLKAIDSPSNTAIEQTSREQVFMSACTDLEYATNNLYSYSNQKGAPVRICKEGSIGVLARVYLSVAGLLNKPDYYKKANDILKPLVDSKTIKLNPDYTQIWKNISADTYDHINKEILFDVDFNSDPIKPLWNGWAGDLSPAAPNSGNEAVGYNLGWWSVTINLWQYYQSDKNDVRYTWNICDYSIDANGNKINYAAYTSNGSNAFIRCAGKFRRDWESFPRYKNQNGSNFPVLRYSDILLMLAESEFQINGVTPLAISCVDEVRSRSKAFKYSTRSVIPTSSEFITIIREERARELCFESTTRYYDLLRWGILIEKFTETGNTFKTLGGTTGNNLANRLYLNFYPHMLLFPIPNSEIQMNPLIKQNPNW
jgi:hypothetical protein